MWARWPARCQILNPQPNPQTAMSYTTSAYFGSPRGLVSCCKTYPSKTVTAEVASSSLVVPAISFQRVTGRDTGNSNPRSNPHLLHRDIHPHGRQEFTLRRPCLVAVFLRVQIEGRLNLAVTQESLDGLRFDFRLVHQPVA